MGMQGLASSKKQSWLGWFLRGILIFGFLILIARLIELQVIKGAYFRSLAEENRIRRVPISAPRGKILARGGEVLAGNIEVKRRVIFDPEEGYLKSSDLEGAKEEELITEWIRDYKFGSALAHVTGYLGEVSADEVGKISPECLEKGPRRLGSLTGRTGLEEMYECVLSGFDGEELVEVDSKGNRIRTLGRKNTVPGEDVKTSIDIGLQKKVAELMRDKKGAIVVSDSKGEILALYSSPSFDPNIFIKNSGSDKLARLLNDKSLPLFNRVIAGLFPPGSVIKPLVALAALEEGEIDENFVYEDTGQITIETPYGSFSYSNWYFNQYGRTEGEIDVVRAIARSTDTFFYKVGELVGIDKLSEWAHKFGLGELVSIDIPGEMAGLVPTPGWKEKVKGERWFLGNTYHLAIGQGDIALTPLQINVGISSIAANGVYCPPQVAVNNDSSSGQFRIPNERCRSLEISDKTVELIKEGMRQACSSGGTGFPFFDSPIPVACKTGTAETSVEEKTHAWFVFFAPIDFPEIVTTVLVEEGGEGAYVAGPIAREIFDFWYLENRN
jgi:penicillin-binding protein 2